MKQLIIVSDMEGASGIFDKTREQRSACWNGSDNWRSYGRICMTSDVLAICNAANDFGIDDILLYDSHEAGASEFNVLLEQLPANVRVFDVPNRENFWRRIRGQAAWQPFGIVTVGSHAMYGVKDSYFPHSMQSPPIAEITVNGRPIGEISLNVLSFKNTPYLANIGCAASHAEACALSPQVECITVKDKTTGFEPPHTETYPVIYRGVMRALQAQKENNGCIIEEPCLFTMSLCDGFHFEAPPHISWKGSFEKTHAVWESPTVEIGLELFEIVRAQIRKNQS